MQGNYFKETRRFAYGVIAVLPLLVVYEYGLWQGTLGDHLNGADAILRVGFLYLAAVFGLRGSMWMLAGVVGILVVGFLWHVRQERIKISIGYVVGIYAEAAIAGIVLAILVYALLGRQWPHFFTFEANSGVIQQLSRQGLVTPWAKIVAAVGAGVFEELLFRALLLGMLYKLWAQRGGAFGSDRSAAVKAALVTSVIFTALHYGSVSTGGLVSIFSSSVLLSGLYLTRGYGVTALAHTAYDVYLMFGVVA